MMNDKQLQEAYLKAYENKYEQMRYEIAKDILAASYIGDTTSFDRFVHDGFAKNAVKAADTLLKELGYEKPDTISTTINS